MIETILAGAGALSTLFGVSMLRFAARERGALSAVLRATRSSIVDAKVGDPVHLQAVVRASGKTVKTPLGEEAVFSRTAVHAYERDLLSPQGEGGRGRWAPVLVHQEGAPRFTIRDDTGSIDVDAAEARFLVGIEHGKTWSTAPGGSPPPTEVLTFIETKGVHLDSKRTGEPRTFKIFVERVRDGDIVDVYGVVRAGGLITRDRTPLVVASSAQLAAQRGDLPMIAARKVGSSLVLGGGSALLAAAVLYFVGV